MDYIVRGVSRSEYWSGQPFPSPGDLPNPGTELKSPALLAEPQGKVAESQTSGSIPINSQHYFTFSTCFRKQSFFSHPHLIEQWMFFNQDYCKSIDVIIIQKWSRFTLSLLINFCKSEGSRNLSTSILYGKGFSSVQSLSRVQLFVTPWTAAHQASLSITSSQNLLKLTPTELVMPSSHLILRHPLLLPPSIFPRIRVFQMSQLFTLGG